MHRFVFEGRDTKVTVHYNGDFSGDVRIVEQSGGAPREVEVPFAALKAFVAEYKRARLIDEVEGLGDDGVLKRSSE